MEYFTIKDAGQSYPLRIKKSKFISSISQIQSEKQANEFIQKICKQHKKANHNCYAYRILNNDGVIKGLVENENDDGEPSGTAGNSILYVLKMQKLVNVVVIVTRYFGGIKLGKGGLTRAYSKSTSELIKTIGVKKLL